MGKVRSFSAWELAMLKRLLAADFPGRDALKAQLDGAKAAEIDAENSIRIEVPVERPPAAVVGRIPVEARAVDTDGVAIYVLLHVLQERMAELEIYRDDSSVVKRLPGPELFEISVHRGDYN